MIKGNDLNALSDDPDQLQSELTALAGPAAGPNGGQIYIDGFSGGQLPPKSSIREIRINQNPFSRAVRPAGLRPHRDPHQAGHRQAARQCAWCNGNDSAFNSLNPFVTQEPAYHTLFAMGSVGGSLGSKISWNGSVFDRNNASNSIVTAVSDATTNAELLAQYPSLNCAAASVAAAYNCSEAVATPQSRLDISPRFDFQLGAKNTLTVRYMLDRQTQTNSGVSGSSLPSQGYNSSGYGNSIQLSDSEVLSETAVNETRFQFNRNTNSQTPYSLAPSVMIQGGFSEGGNGQGSMSDHSELFELENYTTIAVGKHAIEFGGRYRLNRDANESTAGFNGAYMYTSLAAYEANTPSQYSVAVGNANALFKAYDIGMFYQDDYKYTTNLTLSYGLRYEMQNWISDHNDWAPRFSMAWAPGGAKSKTVIRAGYGWFYNRFGTGNMSPGGPGGPGGGGGSSPILSAIRQNGINQQQYVVNDPWFYQGSSNVPTPSQLAGLNQTSAVAPTIDLIAPNLKAALNMQAAAGVEHQFGKFLTTSLTYINSRGVHQFLSDNINAYEPGDCTVSTTTGATTCTGNRANYATYGNDNVDQFQSGGIYKQNQLMVSYSLSAKRVSIFGFYSLTYANADTSGTGYFPSNQFNPAADYGRASFDVRNRIFFGGTLTGPYGITVNPMFNASSGSPFNITTGYDNGDNQFNARPAYATGTSTNVMKTAWGTFDLTPPAGAQQIPYNIGTGPSQWSLNTRVSKTFGIGPKVQGTGQGNGPGGMGPGGGPGGGPRGGGGMPGGGLGPGGLSGNSGRNFFGMGGQTVPRRYSLTFSAMGQNVLNKVNLANPVSVLASPIFGTSNTLAGGFFQSSASNRSIDLQLSFSF